MGRSFGPSRGFDHPPLPPQTPGQQMGKDEPPGATGRVGTTVTNHLGGRLLRIAPEDTGPVVVDVHHVVAAGGAPTGPVAVGIAQTPPVGGEVGHVFGHQRAALLTGRVRGHQVAWWLRGRESVQAHGAPFGVEDWVDLQTPTNAPPPPSFQGPGPGAVSQPGSSNGVAWRGKAGSAARLRRFGSQRLRKKKKKPAIRPRRPMERPTVWNPKLPSRPTLPSIRLPGPHHPTPSPLRDKPSQPAVPYAGRNIWPAGEHCRHLPLTAGRSGAGTVHAPVEYFQPAPLQTMLDGPGGHTGIDELGTAHDPVLACSHSANHRIGTCRGANG